MRIGFAVVLLVGIAACSPQSKILTNRTQLQGEFEAVAVAADALGDSGKVAAEARRLCAGETYCYLLGYRDVAAMPAEGTLPEGIGPPAFAYVKNGATGHEDINYDCRLFKGLGDADCIATTADTEQRGSPEP